jgi:hypothetical protein
MPTHIYMHTGDLDRIASLNAKAAEADERYFRIASPEGVYPFMYYAHNLHFVMVGHLLTGRYEDSLAEAKKMADLAGPHIGEMAPMAEWVMSLQTLSHVRFHKWDAILSTPRPPESQMLTTAFDSVCAGTGTAVDGKEDGGCQRGSRVRGRAREGEGRDARGFVQQRPHGPRHAEPTAKGPACCNRRRGDSAPAGSCRRAGRVSL